MNPKKVKFLKKVIARFQENGEYVGRADPLRWLNQDLFLGVRMGICIPSKCSGEEIQYMARSRKFEIAAADAANFRSFSES